MLLAWRDWCRERLPWRVFVPAIAALTAAACWTAGTLTLPSLAGTAVLVTLLVLQFRLWDDVADRARDAVSHPRRVVVRAGVRTFVALLIGLTVAALVAAWTAGGVEVVALVAGLDAAACVSYGLIRPMVADAIWRFGVVLLKYPMFVVIGARATGVASPDRVWLAAACAFAVAVAYEVGHTRVAVQEGTT
jgi:hypothetical protein